MVIQRNMGLSEKDSSAAGANPLSCTAQGNLMEQHNYRPLNI